MNATPTIDRHSAPPATTIAALTALAVRLEALVASRRK
jgi:hypothetical protein